MPAVDGRIIIYTDLDGTLLDAETYSWAAARPALDLIRAKEYPLVLCSSKTRPELLKIREALDNRHPFIAENGGAVYIPEGYFPFPYSRDMVLEGFSVIELGTPYEQLRSALRVISRRTGVRLRGYGDLSVRAVAEMTGLEWGEARLSRAREYDEPFLIKGNRGDQQRVLAEIERMGLRWTRGGRFYHLTGNNDKGKAVNNLTALYEKHYQRVATIGLGDGYNDLPMFNAVDHPILVQVPGGGYDEDIDLPNLIRAEGEGPTGWNAALIELLRILSDRREA